MATRIRDVQMHVVVYGADANGGPGSPKMELDPDVLNLVWQQSFNAPGRAAFTMARYNSKLSLIEWMVDHIQIIREDDRGSKVVFSGKLVKPSYASGDAIVYCWDYMAFLQRSRTGFKTEYFTKKLGSEIVAPEWALAKAVTNSPFAFVATGTIQDPLGLDGVTVITTNDDFGMTDFNRLFVFASIAEMAMANTANTVKFEITREAPFTFNFWKNYGADKTAYAFSHPGNLMDYAYDVGYDQYRNDIATLVKNADEEDEEYVVTATDVATTTFRRLQDAMTLRTLFGTTGTTETDQGKAAAARMLKEAIRTPRLVLLSPRQNEIAPFDGWELGDNMRTVIQKADRSGDELDAYLKLVSVGAAWTPAHGELLQLYGRSQEAV